MPSVSFVVSSYNQGAFLRECLDSIFEQSAAVDFEIILVDDASTDETDALVQRYSDMRISYVRHERNSGLVSTLNDGFARVQGDFIARIDGDDRYRRDYLKRTLPLFKTHPEIGLVYGDAGLIDATGSVVADYWDAPASRYFHDNRDFKGNEYLELIKRNFIPAPTVIARRAVWQDAFPIPAWLPPQFPAADWYVNLRAARRHEFYYLAQTIADYRLHGRNWHARPTFDRSYEGGVVGIMDQFFGEPDYAAAKQEMRRTCYGDLYTFLGNRYFGLGMRQDARRCYARAVRYRPELMTRPMHLRRWAATWLEPKFYKQLKAVVHGAGT